MPRIDEGLLHAWLDGQLPAEEAARVERLVAADAEWAAAAAEARGLLAGASRVVGALDDVPSVGVGRTDAVAASRARNAHSSRWRGPGLRAAAALLVVAGMSTVVWQRWPGDPREAMQQPPLAVEGVSAPAVALPPAQSVDTLPRVGDVPRESRQGAGIAEQAAGRGTTGAAADRAGGQVRADSFSGRATNRAVGNAAGSAVGGAADTGAATGVSERARQQVAAVRPDSLALARSESAAKALADASGLAARRGADTGGRGVGALGGGRGAGAGRGRAVVAASPAAAEVGPTQLPALFSACWAVRDSTAAADTAGRLTLQFIAPVATDLQSVTVTAPPVPLVERGVVGVRPGAPALTRAMTRVINETTFVAEYMTPTGRTLLNFTSLRDTLRGTSRVEQGDIRLPLQPFEAVRTECR